MINNCFQNRLPK